MVKMMKMSKILECISHIVRVILTFTRPMSDIFVGFISHLIIGATPELPPIKNKILLMTATELSERIRKKELSSVEVVQAYIDRSRKVNKIVNAVVDERYEAALNDAKKVDEFLATNEKSEDDIAKDTPLLGVPFSCKESIGVKGMIQIAGLARAKGRLSPQDNEAVAQYKKAGAIPLVVSNVAELCMWWESSNTVYGRTRNPYDSARIVGGSTGGEAALLSTAGSLFGLGTDIGGSIRIPSCFCGTYGHKTSKGTISNLGVYPDLDEIGLEADKFGTGNYSCIGPMCRYAQDLPLLMHVLTNDDKFRNKVDFRKVKVYYMEEFPGTLNASIPSIKRAIQKAANYFEDEYGTKALPLKVKEMGDAISIWEAKIQESSEYSLKDFLVGKNGSINFPLEFFKFLFGWSKYTTNLIYFGMVEKRDKNEAYYKSLRDFEVLKSKLEELFEEDAILLIPTHPETAPHIPWTIPKFPNIAYTGIVNVLGYPATNIPAGMSSGVPFGIQAVSGLNKDHLTVATAVELDKVFKGWVSPCGIQL